MARPKEFDETVVLRKAMDLFWEQGYGATSMDNLVDHLGIGRASLYSTYGAKHDLFMRALDVYTQDRVTSITEALSQPGPVLPAIRSVLEMFARRACDLNKPGCMLTNSATELATRDPQVQRQVQRTWAALESTLASALARARAQSELGEDRDPHALASFLLVFIQGLLVVGKGDPDPDRLRIATEQALSVLG
jgi:TetR/AcrR family transcriptional regulator, transcriptional repressor for nem operon